MQDAEFVSELVFFLLEQDPMDASKKENIDDYYKKWAAELDAKKASQIKENFTVTIGYLSSLEIDFEKYKINGVSHFYALFALSFHCVNAKSDPVVVSTKLNEFFEWLRTADKLFDDVKEYRESMQANTRSKSQRVRRIKALTHYCGVQ